MKKIANFLILPVMAAFVFLPARGAGADALDIPPHIYSGRVFDFDGGNLATARQSPAEVRARKADGSLLANCKVSFVEGALCNYALTIPMGTKPSPRSAVQGERLSFEIDNGEDTFIVSNVFPAVGLPGRVSRVDLIAAEDKNGNGIADAYEQDMASYMQVMGYEGTYTSKGDYDRDGVSNYDEYLAGSDPFSEDDYLRILSFTPVEENEGIFEATFLPGMNRSYSVQASTNACSVGRSLDFQHRFHQVDSALNGRLRALIQTKAEFQEVQTIYLLKEGDHAVYRLLLE